MATLLETSRIRRQFGLILCLRNFACTDDTFDLNVYCIVYYFYLFLHIIPLSMHLWYCLFVYVHTGDVHMFFKEKKKKRSERSPEERGCEEA